MARPAPEGLRPRDYGRCNVRGVYTLALRGWRRHIGMWTQTLVGTPVAQLLLLLVLVVARDPNLGPLWSDSEGRPIDAASFVACGLIAFTFSHAAFEASGMFVLWDKMENVIQDLLAAPLTAAELLAGWVMGATLAGLSSGLAVTVLFLPFVDWHAFDLLPLLGFALLGTVLFAVLGIFVGLWARKWDHYSAAETFVLMPFGLLSGTFFLRQDLPPFAENLLLANPVFHIIDGFRSGLLGRSDGAPLLGLAILLALIAISALAAWRLILRGWRLKP